MKKEAQSFPADITGFTANGNKYVIAKTISAARYKEYEKLTPALTFGLKFQEIYAQLGKLYAHLNAQKFADASVVCHNIMNGVRTIDDEDRIHPALEMCALVINREDEDQTVYDRTVMIEKIKDWQVEGLDMNSFFRFALSSIEGLRNVLLSSTKASLEEISKEQDQKSI